MLARFRVFALRLGFRGRETRVFTGDEIESELSERAGRLWFLSESRRAARRVNRKCKRAQKLDPLSPFSHISLGYAYYFARDYEKAIEECRKALEMDRNSTFGYRNLGLAYLQQGKLEKAIEALSNAVKFSQGGLAFESYLGFAYAVAGKREEAEEVLASLQI